MARIRKILLRATLIILPLAAASLAIAMSYDAACGPAPALSGGATRMDAIVYRCYGSADVLELAAVEKPAPAEDEVLVKVHAAAVNPLDWHYMRGTPYIMRPMGAGMGRPATDRLGVDFAGTVEAVGSRVTRFQPGDRVFGGRTGAFAEYVTVRENRALARMPENMDFDQAAAVPIAATTALQALRDHARVQPGERVLINGASGGVGTFAVQIAKSLGAEVTGVCSTRNVEMVRAIGADHVIDYTREDFTQGSERYDVIIDMVGNHPLTAARRVLAPDGRFVIVGGPDGKWLGPMVSPLKAMLLSPFVEQQFGMMLAELRQQDLQLLAELMEDGELTPVIDRTYSLAAVPDAIRYLERGRARGKVVVHVANAGGDEAASAQRR